MRTGRYFFLNLREVKKIKIGSNVLTFPKYKMAVSTILATILLTAFVLVPPVVAEGQTSFQNVAVDEAYNMTTSGNFPDLIVLDVRYQYEYDMGHLYDAVLIPYNELETKIGELEGHENHEIIVYCRSGYRSQIASEILSNHGFTKVYNMIGGILAWIEAGYPIYTTSHHVTVNIIEDEIQLQIEPLLLHQTGCASCAQNKTCSGGSKPANITSTVLEQDEKHTVILLTYEVDGTTFEMTMTHTLLWSYNELTDEINRTASLVSTEIITEDASMESYGLSYLVQHAEYNLTLYTSLVPLDSETYNSSFTFMNYAPARKSAVTSLEFVEFNSSVTLSQLYPVLGKVAKEVGKVYEKSGDETLAGLAQGYYTMEEEAKHLGKLVEKQLQEYNRIALGVIEGKVVVGSSVFIDPQAIQNGGFETGNASSWTIGGYGDHMVTSEDRHSGTYSMLIGYKYSPNVAYARDYVYQTISLPSYATNVQLSFHYHLFTEDYAPYNWFEVYVRDSSGNNLAQVFYKAGTKAGLEEFGWEQVTYDLSAYAGQTIQIYFAVANWYDTAFKTWSYIDDVSVTYETCNIACWIDNWIGCLGWVPDFEMACLAGCVIGALACGPFFPICAGYCFAACGIIGDAVMIGCAITAAVYCCL